MSGQSLHLDIVGQIKPASVGGSRFILTCRDEFSKFRMTKSLKVKSETPEAIKLMINQSEMQTGNSALRITTDNGSEFKSQRLTIFLQQKGIQHVLSTPYVPQQNGVERKSIDPGTSQNFD